MFKKGLWAFFLPVFFLIAQALNATGSKPAIEPPCSLAAPANVVADPVGPTYATLSWDPVAGAWGYSLYLTGNGSTTTYITTTTSWNFTGLTPGVAYTVEVHALCAPGSESPNFTTANFNSIVIEIICQVNNSCTTGSLIGTGLTVFHTWVNYESYFFWITGPNGTAKFTFYKTPDNQFPTQPLGGNPNGYKLGMLGGRYCPNYSGNTEQFMVSYNGDAVAAGKFEEKAIMFVLASGYTASVYGGSCSSGGGGSMPTPEGVEATGRLSDQESRTLDLQPLPNPFSDELLLTGSGGAPEDPVQISLFNAEGVLVKQQEAVIEGSYVLPTEDLPSGVYFLRLRSSAGSSTHKLLKM